MSGTKGKAWSQEALHDLLVSIIQQTNPDLSISGWNEITARMGVHGYKVGACKQQWTKLRTDYVSRRGGPAPFGAAATAAGLNDSEKKNMMKSMAARNLESDSISKRAYEKKVVNPFVSDSSEDEDMPDVKEEGQVKVETDEV